MIDEFLLRAGLAGLGVVLAAAPLGCFVVWRRMAYFGDATSHGALLGVALALTLGLPMVLSILIASLGIALAVTGRLAGWLAADTVLGVAAHAALAVGLVAISLSEGFVFDPEGFLFGEILAVSWRDVLFIWIGAVAVLGLFAWRWNRLLLVTLHRDLAVASGMDPRREELVLTVSLAVLVALSLQVLGALLITAMLIIPAAAARPFARTPEGMVLGAAAIGGAAVWLGLFASLEWDTPTSPSIVAAAAAVFALTAALAGRRLGR